LFHSLSLYFFDDAVEDLAHHWDRAPLFAMSHAGHGTNSYGLNVIAAAGPVAAYDPVEDLEQIAATYARLHQVLAAADADDTPARWLLLFSNFRGICQLVDLDSPVPQTKNNGIGYEPMKFPDEHALWRGLVERLPYRFGVGVGVGAGHGIKW
jgi:hypothetical protein